MGSYFVKLDGKVDALVFAGGIGEKSALLRTRVSEKCGSLGFELDQQRNQNPKDAVVAAIGSERAPRATLICQTDEQASLPSIMLLAYVMLTVIAVRNGPAMHHAPKDSRVIGEH